MVTINGIKVDNNNQKQENQIQKTPSINEILDKMQSNYNNLNIVETQKVSTQTHNDAETNVNSNNIFNNDNNLLLSILPLLLNNKSNDGAEILKAEQNKLFHSMIKNLNNPLLEKLFELLPKLNKKPIKTEEKIEKPKIESYIKTDEYNSKN